MSRFRNPFRLRASERIESDASFLRLYSPIVLDALAEKDKEEKLWNNVIYIHSSPGAGKTSLLRIFEPGTLSTLLNSRTANDHRDLYGALKRMAVVDDDGVNVLGITLVCTRNYEILEELNVSNAQKRRYFFSLLNARIILATLRSFVNLYPNSSNNGKALDNITYNYDNSDNYFNDIEFPCTGKQLFNWASNIEKKVYQTIDSFLPVSEIKPEGHDELFSLNVLRPEYFTYNGLRIPEKFLFMLDDCHKLSPGQRIALKKYVVEKRGRFSIWISERLEALDPAENVGSLEGRDYDEINLEKFWSDRPTKFEKVLVNIADKRAAISSEDISSFKEFLENDIQEDALKPNLLENISTTLLKLDDITKFTDKFINWIKYIEEFEGSPLEKAVVTKKVEILIHRNMRRNQLTFEFPLSIEELLEKLKPDLEVSSRLFLSENKTIPYYFGFQDLVKASSYNIEQFLGFSADMFEEMLSNRLSGFPTILNGITQQRILVDIAENKWKDLPKVVPYSTQVIKFLGKIGEECRKDTYKPNAPYVLGVSGFAIKTSEDIFSDQKSWIDNERYLPLLSILSTCIAYNLLEIKKVTQGGQLWDVFYLNRWLCLKFNLPFNYGGWRHKNSEDLLKWIKI